ncbi:hypothetical protein COCCADRAFT_89267, partial [Bipolaris zeicola 26-R-13]
NKHHRYQQANHQKPRRCTTMATPLAGLLKLPLELRQQIYHYVLVPTLENRTLEMTIYYKNYTYKLEGLEPIQSLIFTNRLINHESLHYCFTHFIFHLDNNRYSVLDMMTHFYLKIGKRMRMLVRYIVIPRFGVDIVFSRGGYQHKSSEKLPNIYKGLVTDMHLMFSMLRRFKALEEVHFGLYFFEVRRNKEINPGVMRVDNRDGKREEPGTEEMWDSHIMEVFEKAKRWWPTEKIGIWWEQLPQGVSSAESLRLQEHALQQLRARAAPVQVELVTPSPSSWTIRN